MWNLKTKTKPLEKQIKLEVGGGGESGNWKNVIKRYRLPVVRKISTRNVMYSLMRTATPAVWYMGVLRE